MKSVNFKKFLEMYLLLFNRTAHGKPLFARLLLHKRSLGFRNFIVVNTAQAFALGMYVVGDSVCFLDAFVKYGVDNTDAKLPRRVVVVEHKNGKLFGFACQKFGLIFKLCCHKASLAYLRKR